MSSKAPTMFGATKSTQEGKSGRFNHFLFCLIFNVNSSLFESNVSASNHICLEQIFQKQLILVLVDSGKLLSLRKDLQQLDFLTLEVFPLV